MLIGIEGLPNSGKTVLAVKYIKNDYTNGRKILSNTPLYNIEYEEFNIDEFLSNKDEYRNKLNYATVLLDEITIYMDCRLGSSKQNLLMGYLVLQKRKRHLDIYYTTQNLDLVDYKRLVKYTDMIVYCQEIFIKTPDEKTESVKDWRNYTIIDMRKRHNNITEFNMDISKYYDYYDTDFIIEPLIHMEKTKK
jgi:GTPase SAR1 family protein